jgi:hypothetical protein
MTRMKGARWGLGRILQASGMGILLIGIFESLFVGFQESESLRSMSIEFTYLGIGGVLFLVGLLLERVGRRR